MRDHASWRYASHTFRKVRFMLSQQKAKGSPECPLSRQAPPATMPRSLTRPERRPSLSHSARFSGLRTRMVNEKSEERKTANVIAILLLALLTIIVSLCCTLYLYAPSFLILGWEEPMMKQQDNNTRINQAQLARDCKKKNNTNN